MTLFPLIEGPDETGSGSAGTLPLYRETAWDFAADRPVWRNGAPAWVTGSDAVATWVWNTIHTIRREVDLFSWDWGCEIQNLRGHPFSAAVKESEAVRYLTECLEINPYITDVRQISVTFSDSELSVRCAVDTIYGEVNVSAIGL